MNGETEIDGGDTFLHFGRASVLVVTGAASGIGRQTALDAAGLGLAVSGWDVDAEGVHDLQVEFEARGARAVGIRADVTDSGDVESAFVRTVRELGPVEHLVNNAGPSSFDSIPFDDGLAAAAGSVRLVTDTWLRQPGSHGGTVVNVSSIAGPIAGGGAADWYPTAKSAIAGYTRFLAVNRPNGIRANAVAPGFTETPRTADAFRSEDGRAAIARNPMRRAASPDEISPAILFLLSPAASYINGVLLPVDGGSVIAL